MRQLEFEYFFPLTEQVPLELDYTESQRYYREKNTINNSSYGLYDSSSMKGGGELALNVQSPKLTTTIVLDSDHQFFVQSKEKPSLIRRLAYRALGISWKLKD